MNENYQYKEIIFLNQTELYSALAQLNKGYTDSVVSKSSNDQENSTTNSNDSSAKFGAGIPSVLSGGYQGKKTHTTASSNSESFGKDLNVVLNDYNLNNLISSLDHRNMLTDLEEADEGDFIIHKDTFTLVDFKFSSEVLADRKSHGINTDVKNMMKSSDAWDKDIEKIFKDLARFMNFGNLITQGNILIHMDGLTMFADDKHFRMNNGELQSISFSSRPINVLGIVESKMDNIDINDISSTIAGNGASINNLLSLANIVPSLSEITLSSTGLLHNGDCFVKPIAIYF